MTTDSLFTICFGFGYDKFKLNTKFLTVENLKPIEKHLKLYEFKKINPVSNALWNDMCKYIMNK